jgi:hypothetical protein
LGMILFLNCLRFGLVSSLFSSLFFSPGVTLLSPLILLLLLLSLILLLLLTTLVGFEVVFLMLLVVLSVGSARMLIILFKPRTATWGLFESFSTSGDPACALFTLGVRTVSSDTLGGDASLFGGVVQSRARKIEKGLSFSTRVYTVLRQVKFDGVHRLRSLVLIGGTPCVS